MRLLLKIAIALAALGILAKLMLDSTKLPTELATLHPKSYVAPGFESILEYFRYKFH